MIDSRFIVGIDLGTTNIAAYYVDTREAGSAIRPVPILQAVRSSILMVSPINLEIACNWSLHIFVSLNSWLGLIDAGLRFPLSDANRYEFCARE